MCEGKKKSGTLTLLKGSPGMMCI